MASTSETGHAKNVANFQELISFCKGYTTNYNPAKESLKIVQLENLYQEAINKLETAKSGKTSFDNATNDRRNQFQNLKQLSTKIVNAFAVSGADKLAISDLKSVNKKMQGTTAKKSTKTTTSITEPLETIKTISTSQQSYDRMIDHFANIIQVLEQTPIYSPNETELTLIALKEKRESLQTVNSNLINTYTQYKNSLIQRNVTLYDTLTGLTQTAKEVKLYVKSIFGATSPQFKLISNIEFKMYKE
jgi:hypothetical protein